ncbi:MAG: family 16 glycoside hydrolase [Phycisphaerae bacterium]|nr:family 16 glycoside hydrolase [Phycisphaerae bacterium]
MAVCVSAAAEDTIEGVTVRIFEVQATKPIHAIPTLAQNQTPNVDEVRPTIELKIAAAFHALVAPIVTHVTGSIDVEETGAYRFRLTSDDGSRLQIDGVVVIDHDGRHAATSKTSDAVQLAPGLHPLRLEHFDHGGQRSLVLEWQPSGAADFVVIPAARLRTEPVPARVVAPGRKQLAAARRPGDGTPVAGVHPSFTRTSLLAEGFEPKVGAMAFLPDGRLVIGTFDPLQRDEIQLPDIDAKPADRLLAIEGLMSGDPADVRISTIADGVYEPSGLCAVGDDLYVAHRKAITRLRDTDGDGYFETQDVVASGWEAWNYHQFTFGLVHVPHPDDPRGAGMLYAALSTAMAPPAWEGMGTNAAPNGVMRGGVIEVDLSSRSMRVIAGGTRTPNGIGVGPRGTIFYSDNQGTWMPTSQLAEVVPGRFYGHNNNTNIVPQLADRFPDGGAASVFCDRPRAPAAVYLPQDECANSPTEPVLIPSGPYAGQMLVGELTGGGLRRVALEQVNGVWQGAAFQCTQGLTCGVNRLAWGPDGALYLGGIGAGGNWNWQGTQFGLERLAPNDHVTFEMHTMRATLDGFEITFTKPIDRAWLADPSHYALRSWSYQPTSAYGGAKMDERALTVTEAVASPDGVRVQLTVSGRAPGTCVHLRCDPMSVDGDAIWSTDAWYTLQQMPIDRCSATLNGRPLPRVVAGLGALPGEYGCWLIARSGDVMLVPANDPKAVRTVGRTQSELLALDGALHVAAGDSYASRTHHDSCRLHVEWRSADGSAVVRLMDRFDLTLKATDASAWHAADIWFAPTSATTAMATVLVNGACDQIEIELRGEDELQQGPLRLLGGDDGASFRHCWIEPLEPVRWIAGPWQPMWDAETLAGWAPRGGAADYRVADSEIIGTTRPNTPNTFLVSERTYRDFELLIDFKQHRESNSGIQIRSHVEGGEDRRDGRVIGYQVELDPSPRSFTAGVYDEARRGWLHSLIDAPYARAALRHDAWNSLRIVAQGDVIRTWINGVPAAAVLDAVDREGHIALQVHSVGDRADPLEVRWRRMSIREFTPSVVAGFGVAE